MPTIAQALLESLKSLGVKTVFGLPGGEVVEVLDALRQNDVEFVLAADESSAMFMADGLARLTGVPGVCLTTLGPGASNAVTGMAHAHLDRSPLILITAQKPTPLLPDYTHQVLDLQALFAPISKASYRLEAETAHRDIAQAIALTTAGRPGPVHLQMTNEDALAEIQGPIRLPQARPAPPDATKIAQARELLQGAKRPLILAGVGVEPSRPYVELKTLAETLHAPVIVTPKAKGSLPDDHPLALGCIGLTRTDPVYEVLDEADCLIALGYDVVELVKPWEHPAPLIWVADWPNEDPVLPAQVALVGLPAPVLTALSQTKTAPDSAWGATRVAEFRTQVAAELETLPTPKANRLLPQQVLPILRQALPAHALMTVDVGSHKIFYSLSWPTLAPNRFMLSNGLSSMGFGLPATIGASFAPEMRASKTPLVCVTGDAGLAMCLGDLGLLAEIEHPLIVLVMNDNALDLIRAHQVRRGKPVFGTEFRSPDFVKVAEAYGLPAQRVSTESEVASAMQTALTRQLPMLIEVMLDSISYPTTPTAMKG